MKVTCIVFILLASFFSTVMAQHTPDSVSHASPPLPLFREYRFNLPEKAIEIKWIEDEKTKEPMHGKLAPDGHSIILRNYQKGQSLRVRVVLLNGSMEEYVKSPCYIDPVIDAL